MTVYADDWRQRAKVTGCRRPAVWSHLFAGPHDPEEELHQLAAAISLRREWYQDLPWPHGHYDVTETRRAAAIKAGAVPVTWREAGQMLLEARRGGRRPQGAA